jgi:hypothetical protein
MIASKQARSELGPGRWPAIHVLKAFRQRQ